MAMPRPTGVRRAVAAAAATALFAAVASGCSDPSSATPTSPETVESATSSQEAAVDPTATSTPDAPTTSTVPGPSGSLVPAVTGAIAPPVAVLPRPGHPLPGLDRDAGISARLSDGSTIWFFGDTAERDPRGGVRFFVMGSAAWSAPGEPTVTQDPVVGDRVQTFADPTAAFPACPPEAPYAGMWPTAAVVDPQDPNRVLLWMANVCLGSGSVVASRGSSVAEWRYTPGAPPVDAPIKVTLLNEVLFADRVIGAAVVDGDHVYAYACAPGELTAWANVAPGQPTPDPGRCDVSRVRADAVGDPSRYEAWNGTAFEAGATPAPLALPAPVSPRPEPPVPSGQFSVARAPDGVGFVMLYTPWPGYIGVGDLRVAPAPQGPWSAPVRITLPDCDLEYVAACYGVNLQPDFFEPGRLAFGYYDRLHQPPTQKGAYLLTSVPFEVRQVP